MSASGTSSLFERSQGGENALLVQTHTGAVDEGAQEEFADLARSAGATIAAVLTARVDKPNPAALIASVIRSSLPGFAASAARKRKRPPRGDLYLSTYEVMLAFLPSCFEVLTRFSLISFRASHTIHRATETEGAE